MWTAAKLLPIGVSQSRSEQHLERRPERFPTMDHTESVEQYNARQSKLVISFAGCLMTLHRTIRETAGRALDLCCGSGDFTLLLARYFEFEEVVGVDLSKEMICKAREKAIACGLDKRVRFEVGNALEIGAYGRGFNAVTCNDALHHMNGYKSSYTERFGSLSLSEKVAAKQSALQQVRQLFGAMEGACGTDAVAIATDLVRLKSERITRRYTRAIGAEYWRRGWPRFYRDFSRSMRAAWTNDEIRAAMPCCGDRSRWAHLSQWPIPTTQMVLRAPADEKPLFLRRGFPWEPYGSPIPLKWKLDWSIYMLTLRLNRPHFKK